MKIKHNRTTGLHETIPEYYGYTESKWWKPPEVTRNHLATYRKVPTKFGVLHCDHEGTLGTGTVYWVDNRTHVSLLEITDKTEDELKEMFYPSDWVEYIRSTII